MKDEIKEILEFDFQSQGERIEINEYERDILKDYITNLQNKLEEKNYLYNKLDTESKYAITNLQEELEGYKQERERILNKLDYVKKNKDLQEENERLKLNQTKKVFDTIAELIKNGETCSYRYLIYDLLGFQEKDYADLMGGLAITNMLVDYEEYKSRNEKAIKYNYELQERYCHSALYDYLVASKIYEISEKNIKLLNGGDDNE
mgnify:CR=1 FL=1